MADYTLTHTGVQIDSSLAKADSAVQPSDDAATLGSGAGSDGHVLTADGAGGTSWEAGVAGPEGPQGPAGPQGPQGEIGLTGPAGADGATGPAGPQGPEGPEGPQGTGLTVKGIDTYTNIQAVVAPSAGDLWVQSDTTAEGDAGDGWVWSGSAWTNVGQIRGPQGEIGPAGLQGIQGTQGDAGPAGAEGAVGPQGDTGPAGPEGPTGPQGDAGPQGIQGIQGIQGEVGPAGAAATDTPQTWTAQQTFTETKETVFALTGTTPALDPANGTIQTWTLSGNSTPTEALEAGQSMTLMIDDGSAATITWPTTQWAGGAAPTIAEAGYSVVVLWKVGATLYGIHAGDMS